MVGSRLTPLQSRILQVLSSRGLAGTLTGGAALVGFYLGHRTTRDLDLFWRDRKTLGELPLEITAALGAAGLDVENIQSGATFHRLRVSESSESCVVDLVADAAPVIEPPRRVGSPEATLEIDTPHEILVSKLCALLSRSELRDLGDVEALLDAGGDLERAVIDAPRKDGGFSALTLAWVLEGFPLAAAGHGAGIGHEKISRLQRFRDALVARLLELARPE